MKIAIAITSLVFLVTVGHAIAQITPLMYSEIVKEARRYEKLEGGERVVTNKVLFQKARLDLKPFGSCQPERAA